MPRIQNEFQLLYVARIGGNHNLHNIVVDYISMAQVGKDI